MAAECTVDQSELQAVKSLIILSQKTCGIRILKQRVKKKSSLRFKIYLFTNDHCKRLYTQQNVIESRLRRCISFRLTGSKVLRK